MVLKTLRVCCIYLAIFCIAFTVQSAARILHLPLNLTANKGAGQILLYLIVLGTVLWFTHTIWRRDPLIGVRKYALNWKRSLIGFWLCAALSIAIQAVVYGGLIAVGSVHFSKRAWSEIGISTAFNIVAAQVVMIVLATTEESIFRGFMFTYLRGDDRTRNVLPAVVISSIMFAIVHEFHTPGRWLEPSFFGLLIGLILFGAMLAIIYQATRSLACSIGVHSSFLWLDAFRRRTDVLSINQSHWWMGNNNDLRTAPFAWLLFLSLAALIWLSRVWIERYAAIEGTDSGLPLCAAQPIVPAVVSTDPFTSFAADSSLVEREKSASAANRN